jgi:RHS repeat-associated protein
MCKTFWQNYRKFFQPRKLIKMAGIISLVFLSLATTAQLTYSQSGNEPDVRIGFRGKMCSHNDFSITLNGVTATGNGTDCSVNNWAESNQAFVELKPDQTYQVTITGGTCSSHINFDVPYGYKLFINGKETNTIDKNGFTNGQGDGTWEIVLRPDCTCWGAGEEIGSKGPVLGSLLWAVGLGNLSDGRSAETISIREEVLSTVVYTPASLIYTAPPLTTEVDVVKSGGLLRQVKVPEILADIVTISSSEFDVRLYRAADVGAKSSTTGIYALSGLPLETWKIKNPNSPSTNRLQIIKTQNSFTELSEYTWDSATNSWSLSRGNGTRLETETETIDLPNGNRTETTTIKNISNQVVSKTSRTYHNFPWGEELIRVIVDPDSALLTTEYTYFQDPAQKGKYHKIQSVSFPDGSWEKYDYDEDGNQSLVLRPWKDLPLAGATESNSRATYYTYENHDGLEASAFSRHISSEIEKIAGVTVSKTTYSRSSKTINGQPAIIETIVNFASEINSQKTVRTVFHQNAAPFYANKVISIEYPDGRKDNYSYEKGDYVTNVDPSLNTFTLNANGSFVRQTIIHATTNFPNGITNKTTKETNISSQSGRNLLSEMYVYNGASYERIAWRASVYNDRGQETQTTKHNGEIVSKTWDGNRLLSVINESGIETVYSNFDDLSRSRTVTLKGISAGNGYPAQNDVVTTYVFDPEGRETSQTVTGGSLSLTKSAVYDVAGRVQSETDTAGITTSYTYTAGGRIRTVTNSGGITQTAENYFDGQLKKETGSAVVSRFLDYAVNASDGTISTTEYTGTGDATSPRWSRTTADWLSRVIKMESPTTSGTMTQVMSYDNFGQMQRQTTLSGTTKLISDSLFEYDELGRQIRSGLDVDNNGALTAGSTDRFNEMTAIYEKTGSDWFFVTTNKIYLTDNSATATITTQKERLTNFPVNGNAKTVSETFNIDNVGNQKKVFVVIDRSAKNLTQTTDVPNASIDQVFISVNGLLQSSSPMTPETSTSYAYDALRRQIGITDPRTGLTSTTYNHTTGQITAYTGTTQSITYEYYPANVQNAGQIKSITNAAGKKVFFNYNARGQTIQKWGDLTYPTEYVFDNYGQNTELHTFRGGSNWSGTAWSSTPGTADITKWNFDPATGVLQSKQDANASQVTYTYDASNRVSTRTWARTTAGSQPIATSYGYDLRTGDLTLIDYSDNTPDVTFQYNRGGRPSIVTDAAGTRTLAYDNNGNLQNEQIGTGIMDGVKLTYGYDALLRLSSLQAGLNNATLISQSYGYDANSRLSSVAVGSRTAAYAYETATGLLQSTAFTGGTTISRTYENGRIKTISTTAPSGDKANHLYSYNNLSRRDKVTREDNSYWSYIYNDRGEVTSGKKYWADNTLFAGLQFEYDYDNIGNRKWIKQGGNEQGANLRQSIYTANTLNQYSQRTNPGAFDVVGTALPSATVTVNNESVYRRGDYFQKLLSVNNSAGAIYQQTDVVGARNSTTVGGEDAVSQQTGKVYIPPTTENYSYDLDGNLLTDGRWQYIWDAENRLASMTALAGAPSDAKRKLEFVYDYRGRRIQKKVYTWNTGTSSYQLLSITKFVYNGWSLIAELDANNVLRKSYIWVGGQLLFFKEANKTYQIGTDGNENITALVDSATGRISAEYDYEAFGNKTKIIGEAAYKNPFRFSGKYEDDETGFIYYGYRYFNPQIGRWISKDPIEETGGINLYGFISNDPTNSIDYLGLWKRESNWTGGWQNYSGTVVAEKCDTFAGLAQQLTGYASDWRYLKGVSNLAEIGQVVDISPLLTRFEIRLRDSVVKATKSFTAGAFAVPIPYPDQDAASINRYFRRNNLKAECTYATNFVLAKGLIDYLKKGEFDLLGYGWKIQERLPVATKRVGNVYNAFHGDVLYFANYSDYSSLAPNGAWRGENVIALPGSLFWGWGVGVYPYEEFEKRLLNEYRAVGGKRTYDYPRFDGEVMFLNVPEIAMLVFDIRGIKK